MGNNNADNRNAQVSAKSLLDKLNANINGGSAGSEPAPRAARPGRGDGDMDNLGNSGARSGVGRAENAQGTDRPARQSGRGYIYPDISDYSAQTDNNNDNYNIYNDDINNSVSAKPSDDAPKQERTVYHFRRSGKRVKPVTEPVKKPSDKSAKSDKAEKIEKPEIISV